MMKVTFRDLVKPAMLPVILLCFGMTPAAHAEVTWPNLMADPDNAELNRQFVSERLTEGDLPAALSAVERLIILRPTDIPARILRAEILVNLANDTLAKGELDALAKLPLRPEQSERIKRLQDILKSRAKRWRTSASLSLGVRGSDNANNYPSSGLMDFKLNATTPAATRQYESYGGATKTTRELAGVASTVVASTYELPNQNRDTLTAGISHAEARGRKYHYLTNSTTTAFAGASLRLGAIGIRPNLRLTETHDETNPSSTIGAGSLTASYTLPFNVQSYVNAEYSIVNRIPSQKFSTANQNDGHSRSFKLGLSRSILPQVLLFAEGSYIAYNPMETRFTAAAIPYMQSKANQNRRQAGTIGVIVSATPNIRMRASVDASDSKYDNEDPTSKKYRRDTQTRTSIGMQIAGQTVSRKLEKFSLGINVSTTKNDSNIKQNDYKRSDASITMNYRLAD
jgi:hypothetical protein